MFLQMKNDNAGVWVERTGTLMPPAKDAIQYVRPHTYAMSLLTQIVLVSDGLGFALEINQDPEIMPGSETRFISFHPLSGEAVVEYEGGNSNPITLASVWAAVPTHPASSDSGNARVLLRFEDDTIKTRERFSDSWVARARPWGGAGQHVTKAFLTNTMTWVITNAGKLFGYGTGAVGVRDSSGVSLVLQTSLDVEDILDATYEGIYSAAEHNEYLDTAGHLFKRVFTNVAGSFTHDFTDVQVGSATYTELTSLIRVSTDGRLRTPNNGTELIPYVSDVAQTPDSDWAKIWTGQMFTVNNVSDPLRREIIAVALKDDGSLWALEWRTPFVSFNPTELTFTGTAAEVVLSTNNIVLRLTDGKLWYWGEGTHLPVALSDPAAVYTTAIEGDPDTPDATQRVFTSIAGNKMALYALDTSGRIWSTMLVSGIGIAGPATYLKYSLEDFGAGPYTFVAALTDTGYEAICASAAGVFGSQLGGGALPDYEGTEDGVRPLPITGTVTAVHYGTVVTDEGVWQVARGGTRKNDDDADIGGTYMYTTFDGPINIVDDFEAIAPACTFETLVSGGDASLTVAIGHNAVGAYSMFVWGVRNYRLTKAESTPLASPVLVLSQTSDVIPVFQDWIYLFTTSGTYCANYNARAIWPVSTGGAVQYPPLGNRTAYPVEVDGSFTPYACAETKISDDDWLSAPTYSLLPSAKITLGAPGAYPTYIFTALVDQTSLVHAMDGSQLSAGESCTLDFKGTATRILYTAEGGYAVVDRFDAGVPYIASWGNARPEIGLPPRTDDNVPLIFSCAGRKNRLLPAVQSGARKFSHTNGVLALYHDRLYRTANSFSDGKEFQWYLAASPVKYTDIVMVAGSPERYIILDRFGKVHMFPTDTGWYTWPGTARYTKVFAPVGPVMFAIRADGTLWSGKTNIISVGGATFESELLTANVGRVSTATVGQVGTSTGWTHVEGGLTEAQSCMSGIRDGHLYVWGKTPMCGIPGVSGYADSIPGDGADITVEPLEIGSGSVWKKLYPGGVALNASNELFLFGLGTKAAFVMNGETWTDDELRQVDGTWRAACWGGKGIEDPNGAATDRAFFALSMNGALHRIGKVLNVPSPVAARIGEDANAIGIPTSGDPSATYITIKVLDDVNWVDMPQPGVFVRSAVGANGLASE